MQRKPERRSPGSPGTKREKRTQKVVTLKYGKEMHDIAVLKVSQ